MAHSCDQLLSELQGEVLFSIVETIIHLFENHLLLSLMLTSSDMDASRLCFKAGALTTGFSLNFFQSTTNVHIRCRYVLLIHVA